MAEKLHNLSEKLPDDDGSPGPPSGTSAQPPTPPRPDTTDFGHGPVTGSAQITAMNVDDARLAIRHLWAAHEDIAIAGDHCRTLEAIKGPGEEPASQEYAGNANKNGARHRLANETLQKNIRAEIAQLQQAIDSVVNTENVNATDFRKKL